MELQGQQGIPGGSQIRTVQLDPLLGLLTTGLRARYAELSRRGQVFTSYVATVATSVPATATIGNMVWNPPGSGVRLELIRWGSLIVATSASCTGIAIAGGYQTTTPTSTTGATVTGSTNISQVTLKSGKAAAYSIATVLTVPVIIMPLHHNTAAIATTGVDDMVGDFDGLITVEEGGFVTLTALGAAAASSAHTSALLWAEIATK